MKFNFSPFGDGTGSGSTSGHSPLASSIHHGPIVPQMYNLIDGPGK
jgi:hypothetical protein